MGGSSDKERDESKNGGEMMRPLRLRCHTRTDASCSTVCVKLCVCVSACNHPHAVMSSLQEQIRKDW